MAGLLTSIVSECHAAEHEDLIALNVHGMVSPASLHWLKSYKSRPMLIKYESVVQESSEGRQVSTKKVASALRADYTARSLR